MKTARRTNAEFWELSLNGGSDCDNGDSMISKSPVGFFLIHPILLPYRLSSKCSDSSLLPAQADPSATR